MIKNYFKTAFRNLKRNKSYTLINIAGLAVGIAACLLIFLVIRFETSFDNFHPGKAHIYRIASVYNEQNEISYAGGSSFAVGPALRLDFPQVKVASIFKSGNDQISFETGDQIKKFPADVYYTEPEFFKMFDFPLLAGDSKSALSKPATAILTQEVAEKFFGNWQNAIGQTIKYNNDNQQVYLITGILKNIPANTDFPLGVVVSYSTLQTMAIKPQLTDWNSQFGGAFTFVSLPDNYSTTKFNQELAAFAKRHKPAEASKDSYIAQPLADMHREKDFGNFRNKYFSKPLITTMQLIGLFLLVIACVNFINLATAQSVNRSKEVGVRKVLGSSRSQLAIQLLGEAGIITVFSVFIAVVIASAILPFLNNFLDVKLSLNYFNDGSLFLFLLAVTVAVTFLSGLYPAVVLSGFNPINALKSKMPARSVSGISLRRGLVILQFVIAHALIIGTLIIVSQMDYFRNAELGFDKAAIITVPIPNDSASRAKLDRLQNNLLENPGIRNVSFSYASPSSPANWSSVFKFDHSEKNTDFGANLKWADSKYFQMYKLRFLAGGPYAESDTTRGFVVNQTLISKLGIKNPVDAIGKEINFWNGTSVGLIVGVVKDFNSYSLKDPMAPVLLGSWKRFYQTINIKFTPGQEQKTIAYVEKLWNQTYPQYVYSYSFLDDTIAGFYKQENKLSILYKIFAAIAIFISCLGLYGLVTFMAAKRTKEVGIRKALGATAANIVYLFSKEFSLLILIAFVIAAPLAWYFMNNWLQDYTYRIKPGIAVFLIAIIGSLVVAWLTVGYQAIKAAIANPIKSLRTE